MDSRLQYGIVAWGTAKQNVLNELVLRQNKIIRIITSTKKTAYNTSIQKTRYDKNVRHIWI